MDGWMGSGGRVGYTLGCFNGWRFIPPGFSESPLKGGEDIYIYPIDSHLI